jgi:hypothetical protein
VISWKILDDDEPVAGPKAPNDARFLSVPYQIPVAALRRGRALLGRQPGGKPTEESTEELAATFHLFGADVQLTRALPDKRLFVGGGAVLDDFIRLSHLKDSKAVAAFAAHWGPLGICEHMLPFSHSISHRSLFSTDAVCTPLGVCQGRQQGWEPVEKWFEYSEEAREIVHSTSELKNSRHRSRDALERLFGRVTEWLDLAAVRLKGYPRIDPKESWPCGFTITQEIVSVFQIVALQLLAVTAGGRELAQCTHCGLPFLVTGYRPGKRNFCPTCIKQKVPARYASRDYRARKTETGDK